MTTIVLSLVFLAVWAATAFLFWVERKARIEVESRWNKTREELILATRTLKAVSAVATRASKQNEPAVVEGNIRAFVDSAREMDISGHRKRQQVLLAFLKAHPGTSTQAAELAIEKILAETSEGKNGG